jgi:hypothetical protein
VEETIDPQSDPFPSTAALGPALSLPVSDPPSPAPGSFALRLLLFNRRLIPFFSLEREPRMSSMSVLSQRRRWLR